MAFKFAGAMVGLVTAVLLIALLTAVPVMLLWNAIVPSIFELREIDLVDALWLALLCGFLFKTSSAGKD